MGRQQEKDLGPLKTWRKSHAYFEMDRHSCFAGFAERSCTGSGEFAIVRTTDCNRRNANRTAFAAVRHSACADCRIFLIKLMPGAKSRNCAMHLCRCWEFSNSQTIHSNKTISSKIYISTTSLRSVRSFCRNIIPHKTCITDHCTRS